MTVILHRRVESLPSESVDPISIAGFSIAGAIMLGLAVWLSITLARKRATATRERIRNDAFLSVRGLRMERRSSLSRPPQSEKTPVTPFPYSRQNAVIPPPRAVLQPPPPRVDNAADVVTYHRQSGTLPKPFSFALSAASPSAKTRDSLSVATRNRFSVHSSTSSVDSNPTVGTVRKVRQTFDAVLPDELVIHIGESLTLVQSLDDGWCLVSRGNSTRKSLRPKTDVGENIELGVVPAWCFIRHAPGLLAERPTRSSSLGITVKLDTPETVTPRERVISWSNF